MIIERIWLHKIDYVEPVGFARFRVRHPKVVPLGVSARVIVGLKDEVILVFINLNCSPQVAALES